MIYSNSIKRESLSRSIKKDKLAHAYIVSGGDSCDRDEYIKKIVQEIFCLNKDKSPCGTCLNCTKIENNNLEDLITIDKDGNSIKVEQIKELVQVLGNKPFTSRTVVVINEAHKMTSESQNKLLKSLEEPGEGSIIILSTDNVFGLYQTIRSRCIILNMDVKSVTIDSEFDVTASNVVKYSMSNKPLNVIFEEVNLIIDSAADAEKLLLAMEIFLRDILVGRYSKELLFDKSHEEIVSRINWEKGFPFREYLTHIKNTKNEIARNINWKYSIKNLIIKFKQEELHG